MSIHKLLVSAISFSTVNLKIDFIHQNHVSAVRDGSGGTYKDSIDRERDVGGRQNSKLWTSTIKLRPNEGLIRDERTQDSLNLPNQASWNRSCLRFHGKPVWTCSIHISWSNQQLSCHWHDSDGNLYRKCSCLCEQTRYFRGPYFTSKIIQKLWKLGRISRLRYFSRFQQKLGP